MRLCRCMVSKLETTDVPQEFFNVVAQHNLSFKAVIREIDVLSISKHQSCVYHSQKEIMTIIQSENCIDIYVVIYSMSGFSHFGNILDLKYGMSQSRVLATVYDVTDKSLLHFYKSLGFYISKVAFEQNSK